MLAFMACLRLYFYVATPTEMIFDRAFPFLTVKFFIGALVQSGSYSALKLNGVLRRVGGAARRRRRGRGGLRLVPLVARPAG